MVDHREQVEQPGAERTDRGDEADLAREDRLTRGRVGAVRLGIRHRLRRIFGVENPDCSVRVVHALETHALEAPRLGPRRQVRAVYVQTVPRAGRRGP